MILFCASIGHTSVSNALFIFATAPLIAAALSWVFLRETVPIQTLMAIIVSMIGVTVIVSGSFGGTSLLGDGLAFLNACTVAGFYVALRKIGPKNMLPSIGAGYVIGAICVMPFAEFQVLFTCADWVFVPKWCLDFTCRNWIAEHWTTLFARCRSVDVHRVRGDTRAITRLVCIGRKPRWSKPDRGRDYHQRNFCTYPMATAQRAK